MTTVLGRFNVTPPEGATEDRLPDPIFFKIMLAAVNPQLLDSIKPCLDCSGVVERVHTVSEIFGEISCFPESCESCRAKNMKKLEEKRARDAYERFSVRCAGRQNTLVSHVNQTPTLANVQQHKHQAELIGYVHDVLARRESRGAYIYGPSGTGKTYLVKVLANELHAQFRNFCFIKAVDMAMVFRSAAAKFAQGDLTKQFKNVDVLIIDDYGTQKNTDFIKEMVFSVLDYRYENKKITILTSNLPHGEIDESDKRLSSRLSDPSETKRILVFSNEDLRERNRAPVEIPWE